MKRPNLMNTKQALLDVYCRQAKALRFMLSSDPSTLNLGLLIEDLDNIKQTLVELQATGNNPDR